MVDFKFYLITDRKQTEGRSLIEVLKPAFDGGLKAVQIREKDLPAKELCLLCEKIMKIASFYKAKVLVNDRVDIAMSCGLDGVHLPSAGVPAGDARILLGVKKLIGVSTHSPYEAENAQKQCADFITFGPVFYTKSKAKYGNPQGIEKLAEVAKNVKLPLFALGGINETNILNVLNTGIYGISMISAIMKSSDPKKKTEEFLRFIKEN